MPTDCIFIRWSTNAAIAARRRRRLGLLLPVLMGMATPAAWAQSATRDNSADQAILQQAANAMVFQTTFADIALASSQDEIIRSLAQHIHDLSVRGQADIEAMGTDRRVPVRGHLDTIAWRRVGALRQVAAGPLRDQMYLDGQMMRLYEARLENMHATVHARDTAIKAFTLRSTPEIDALIGRVRAASQAFAVAHP